MEHNKQNKQKRRGGLSTLLIWACIFGCLLLLLSGDCAGRKPEEINFTQFAEAYEEDNVKAVYEVLASGTFYGMYRDNTAEATKLPKNADFVLYMQNDTFHENMRTLAASQQEGLDKENVLPSDYGFVMTSALPTDDSWIWQLLPILGLLGVMIFFFVYMSRMQGGKQMQDFSKSRAKLQDPSKARVTFKDVAGVDEEKEELQEVVEFMRDPKRFSEMGARIPKGVLLVGPPGTGKTLLAKAVAGEAKVPFFSITGSDFVEMFVGVGASRVRDLFDTAKRAAPAVIFIDEIDAVGRQRGAGLGGGHDEREQTLNQLLVEMDGFETNQGVIVLAATNRADILDPALLRPGRFDRRVTVGYPDVKGREEILKIHARNKRFAPNISLKTLAKRTSYFTGADLENVLNEAAILATRAKRNRIEQQDLEEAVTRVQMGPEKKSRVVTEEDRRITSYHECGHAILTLELKHSDKLHEVSVISRGGAAGYTMMLPNEDVTFVRKSKLLDRICMALGGRVAEEIVFKDVSTGAIQDLKSSSEIARNMVEQYGMSEKIGPVFLGGDTEVFIAKDWGHSKVYSEELSAKIDSEIRSILDEQYARAKTILTENREGLERVAQFLIRYERVTGEQFERVYRGEDAEAVMREEQKTEPQTVSAEPVAEETVAESTEDSEQEV